MKVQNVRKIAVLRANAIGDFVFGLPALAALRAAYPHAEVVYLGQPWHGGFLQGRHEILDRVVVVPKSKVLLGKGIDEANEADRQEAECFFDEMRRERFDLAVQLHGGGGHSNPFVQRLGARVTVGMRAKDAPELDRWVPYRYWQREVLRLLEVVSLVGATPVSVEPSLTLTMRDVGESLEAVPETREPLVVLHPGAGDPRRRWPADKFAAVGDLLRSAGARVLVTGVEDEQEVAEAVVDGMRGEADNLCGRLSLEALTGLLSRCRVVISNDSGPLHLARAVGTPTVGIYWAGNLINAGPMTLARHLAFLSWQLQCPTCGANCITDPCTHRPSFVADVPVAEVAGGALELFNNDHL